MISQCLTEMVKMILHLNLEWKLGTKGNSVKILQMQRKSLSVLDIVCIACVDVSVDLW